MKPIPLLPLAPRPFEDELISSWQGRVAVRYALGIAEIDTWLSLSNSVSEDHDVHPDPENLRRWARACRVRRDVVEKLALSHHAAPFGYVLRSRWRGICPACLEDDRRNHRDQYLRRTWSRAETVACPIHRLRLRYFCPGCFTQCGFRFEYRDGLAELICSGCLTAVSRAPPKTSEVRHADLLIATMEAVNDAKTGTGEANLDEINKAIRFLWTVSPNGTRPEISFFNVEHTFGRAFLPVGPHGPMVCLSITWRAATLLTIAQMLDIGSARCAFGPPIGGLAFAFHQFERGSAPEERTCRQSKQKTIKIGLSLRSDDMYLRLATRAIDGPQRQTIAGLEGRDRSKLLSRLARHILGSTPDGHEP